MRTESRFGVFFTRRSGRRGLLMLLLLTCAGAAVAQISKTVGVPGAVSPHFRMIALDPSFDPNAPVGGVPFCFSGSLGTVLCNPPSFLKKAYHFPRSDGEGGHNGEGSTVVIVDAFGSPTIQSDLNKFIATFNLPAATVDVRCGPTWSGAATDNCPVKTIADLQNAPNASLCGATGWAEETTLDVTMVHALAPRAKIVLVVANDCLDQDITAAEAAVVAQESLRGSVMSQSFGEAEDFVGCNAVNQNLQCTSFDPTIQANADAAYQTATNHKWTIIASSGDDGANEDARENGTGELTPGWPASNPLNLAAGGTQGQPYGGQYGPPPGKGGTFSCPAETNCNTGLVIINGGENGCGTAARPGVPSSCTPVGYGGEAAWNEFNTFGLGTSTGGGVSALYGRPRFQRHLPDEFDTLLGAEVEATGRLNPDVAFNSSIHGGVLAFLGFLNGGNGLWGVFGGTSASSPAWAAIIALVNQAHGGPVGYITPRIYSLRGMGVSPFHDIRIGNNSDTDGQFGVDGYLAQRGYDLTTGEGTPNVSEFIQVMSELSNGE